MARQGRRRRFEEAPGLSPGGEGEISGLNVIHPKPQNDGPAAFDERLGDLALFPLPVQLSDDSRIGRIRRPSFEGRTFAGRISIVS